MWVKMEDGTRLKDGGLPRHAFECQAMWGCDIESGGYHSPHNLSFAKWTISKDYYFGDSTKDTYHGGWVCHRCARKWNQFSWILNFVNQKTKSLADHLIENNIHISYRNLD